MMNTTELTWFKSGHSDSEGGECVEVAAHPAVHVRDSKNADGPRLTLAPASRAAFATAVASGM
ncbi:DUF397 domain-containing protein [Streptomyces sp. NBC_01216]|uniref:DUF397 domain-containing protein n=1 Tax=Streptomyces sp. NBC_01216 TaxID=2903778 RepID=UPI003FA372E7